MTRKLFTMLILVGIAAGWLLQPVLAKKGNGQGGCSTPKLTLREAADVLFMREEEKLARDVYTTLFAEWGTRVFDKISDSERQHMQAILGLINKYALVDPAQDFGKFSDPKLQELFDSLVVTGLKSEVEALYVGALIEEVDMEDLVHAIDRTKKSDLRNVYGNLLAGSENHLRTFVKNIEAMTGGRYEAQWMAQTEVDEILGH